jgi:hypothetical protein
MLFDEHAGHLLLELPGVAGVQLVDEQGGDGDVADKFDTQLHSCGSFVASSGLGLFDKATQFLPLASR